jgi:CHAT domain-containing protein
LNQNIRVILRKNFEKNNGTESVEYAFFCNSLGLFYQQKGNFEAAEYNFNIGKDIIKDKLGENHSEYITFLTNLASVYLSAGSLDKSEAIFMKAKSIFEKNNNKNSKNYVLLLQNILQLYVMQGRYVEAEKMVDNINGIYLQSFAFKANNPALAGWLYDNTLALKGILLQSSQKMRSRIMNGNNEALKKLFGEWQDQRSYLAKLYSIGKASIEKQGIDLVKEEAKANDLEKQLSLKSELFAEEIDKNKKRVVWQDVQKQLKAGEVAIEINRFQLFDKEWTDKTMYTVLILSPQKAQPEMLFLENGNWIEKEALDIYQKYYQSDNAEGKDAELYNRLWLPIVKALPAGTHKVFVSADGAYHQINLQTLFNPASQKYAVEEMEIVMVSTTKELAQPKSTPALPTSCVLVGNPDYTLNLNNGRVIDKRSFNDLVSTQNEVETIAKFTTSRHIKTQVYVGKEASEAVIKSLQSPSILHISTHGTYQDGAVKKRSGNPLRKDIPSTTSQIGDMAHDFSPLVDNPLLKSMLFFTGAEWAWQERLEANLTGEDGLLKAYEAMNLNLDDTDLVVLSACETSLGKINAGEGVYGLRRAFQQAGANAVIASLWKVREDATQDFMVLFYENWLTHNMSKRKAFDEAQKAIKAQEKYKKPYFWGAFVMVGE